MHGWSGHWILQHKCPTNIVLDDDDDDDGDSERVSPKLNKAGRLRVQKCNQDHVKSCRLRRQCNLSAQITYQQKQKGQQRA